MFLIRAGKELSLDERTGINLDAWYSWVVSHEFLRHACTKIYARSHKMSSIHVHIFERVGPLKFL